MSDTYDPQAALAAQQLRQSQSQPQQQTTTATRRKRKSVTFNIGGYLYPSRQEDCARDLDLDSDSSDDERAAERGFPSGRLLDRAIFLKSYTTNALQQVKKGHTAEYHELVKLFLWSRPTATFNRLDQQQQQQQQRSSEDQAQQLLPWLPALSENVSRLDLTYHALVSAIVCNNWMSNSIPEFYAKYRTLVLQIITAQPAWIPEIIRALVSWFFYRSTRASAGRADTQVVHSRVHELLQKIFALVPTAPSSLYTAIHSAFPHKREKFSRQKLYLTNVLRALEYTPSIRRSVLGLIFDRILQIDVEIQVEVEELELGQHTDLPSADNYDEPPNSPQDGDIFELELDSGAPPPPLSPSLAQLSNVESTDEFNAPLGEASVPPGDGDDEFSSDEGSEAELEEDEAAVMSYNVNELLDKLDVMLDLVLSWIKQQFSDALSNESKQVEFHQLFLNCLEIFDSVLLPTFKSRYTQFVMFYMCSLDAYFCDLFLGGIVAKLGDPIPSRQVMLKEGESVVIRVAAASYLGSFVARANYLSSTVVRNVMGVLTQWVNTYLDWLEQPSDEQICYEKGGAGYTQQQQQSRDSAAAVMNQHRHSVFYAVSQAIMYIFCFRWRELTASNDPAFESSEADRLDLYTTPSRSFGKHGSSDLDAYSLRVNGNSPDMCDIKWCPELSGIHRLIFSRLNPLKVCAPAVAQQFAHIGNETTFIFCYTLLRQNQRAQTSVSRHSGSDADSDAVSNANSTTTSSGVTIGNRAGLLHHEIETFFPFDPITLPLSRRYIEELYMAWQGLGESDSSEDDEYDDDEEEEEKEEEEEEEVGETNGVGGEKGVASNNKRAGDGGERTENGNGGNPYRRNGLQINKPNNDDVNDRFMTMSISPTVTIDIDLRNETVKGVTEIFLDPKGPGLRLISLHCERPMVHHVEINGIKCTYTHYFDQDDEEARRRLMGVYDNDDPGELNINVPDELVMAMAEEAMRAVSESKVGAAQEWRPRTLKVKVYFSLVRPLSGLVFLTGSYSTYHPSFAYTQCQMEPGYARKWLPCLDTLHERCTWDIRYVVPAFVSFVDPESDGGAEQRKPVVAVSGGELIAQVVHPVDPSKRLYRYMQSVPSPACAIVFAIGPFGSCLRVDKAFLEDSSKSAALYHEFESQEENVAEGSGNSGVERDTRANGEGDEDEEEDEEEEGDDHRGSGGKAADRVPEAANQNGMPVVASKKPDYDRRAEGSNAEGARAGDREPLAPFKDQAHQRSAIEAVGGIFAFAPDSYAKELPTTCKFISEAFAFHSREFYSYPFTTYKLVFVDGLCEPLISGAAITLVSTDYLHPDDVIEPVYETRRCLSLAIAQQWFGVYITPETWCDRWLVVGLAGLISSLFIRRHLGTNEYRYRLKQDLTRLSHADVNQKPICFPEQTTALTEAEKEFVQLKAPIVLYMLDKRMMKGGISLGLHRVIPKIMMAAMGGDLPRANSINTGWFLKLCRKVSGVNLKSFAEQWIYGSGCPIFRFSYSFNRKKLVVEIQMTQESTNKNATAPWAKPQIFTGQMIARVREADGTPYEHVLDIREARKKFEVQFNTKYKRIRRTTKRFHMRQMAAAAEELAVNTEVLGLEDDDETYSNIALFGTESEEMKRSWGIVEWGEADEESLASATLEWVRMDSDLDWACIIHFEQADFMWAAQLQKDRDVTAQLDAVKALEKQPSLAASTTLMRTIMDSRVYYRVRVDAALALTKFARPELNWIGLYHLIKIYQYRYCLSPDGGDGSGASGSDIAAARLPRSNNFANIGEYFTQKAIISALSNIRHELADAPHAVKDLILNSLQYNDNSENVFSDGEYVATLLMALVNVHLDLDSGSGSGEVADDAISGARERQIQTVLRTLERLRKLDALIPTHQNTVTVAYLKSMVKLALACPEMDLFDPSLFLSMSFSSNYRAVRVAALEGLIMYWGLQRGAVVEYYLSVATDSLDPQMAEAATYLILLAIVTQVCSHERQNTDDDLIIEELGFQRPDEKNQNIKLATALNYIAEVLPNNPNIQLMLYSALRESTCNSATHQLLGYIYRVSYRWPRAYKFLQDRAPIKKLKIRLGGLASRSEGGVAAPPLPPATLSAGSEQQRIIQRGGSPPSPSNRPLMSLIKPIKIKLKSSVTRPTDYYESVSIGARSPSAASLTPLPHDAETGRRARSPLYDEHSAEIPESPTHMAIEDDIYLPEAPIRVTPHPRRRSRGRRVSHGSAGTPEVQISPPPRGSILLHAQPSPTSSPLPPPLSPSVLSPLLSATTHHEIKPRMNTKTKKKLRKLLRGLISHPSAYPFNRPVDPELDGCPTYYDVIKHPMDLSTMKAKLERNEYLTPQDFERDIRLMFENCFTFNPPNTLVYTMGQELENEFEAEWASPEYGFREEEVNQTIDESAATLSSAAGPAAGPESGHKQAAIKQEMEEEEEEEQQQLWPSPPPTMPQLASQMPVRHGIVEAEGERPSTDGEAVTRKRQRRKSRRESVPVSAPSVVEVPAADEPQPQPVAQEEGGQKKPSRSLKIRIKLRSAQQEDPASTEVPPSRPLSVAAEQESVIKEEEEEEEKEKESQGRAAAPSPALAAAESHQFQQAQPSNQLELTKCRRILRKLQTHPSALEFLHPVDPIKQGVPDYPKIVKHPMDLGTMDEKLASGQYANAQQFREDFEFVISNCKLFNPKGTIVYDMGLSLNSVFEKAWGKEFGAQPGQGGVSTPSSIATGGVSEPSHAVAVAVANNGLDAAESLASINNPPIAGASDEALELPMDPKMHKKVVMIVNKLMRNPHAGPFLHPVDPIALGVPTYFDIIKHPMDLGTIKKKLNAREYPTAAELISDVRLMFDNCFLFNPADDWVHQYGRKLEAQFNDLLRKEKWTWFLD